MLHATLRKVNCPLWPCRNLLISSIVQSNAAKNSPKPFGAIPGPKPLPIAGNIFDMRNNSKRLRLFFDECFGKYGEIFKLKVFDSNIVVVKDPDTIEYVLRAEGRYPSRDNVVTKNIAWLYKNRSEQTVVLSMEEGERWKQLRSAMGKQATPRNVQCYTSGFNAVTDRFLEHIKSTRGDDGTISDVTISMQRLLTEVSAKFIFGTDMLVMTNPTKEHRDFIDAVKYVNSLFTRLTSELPLYKLYHNKLSKEFVEASKVLDNIARKELDKLYSKLSSGEESETPGLLEQWLREGKLSEEDAIGQALGLFSAGIDATSYQSIYLLHAIAKYPEVQERLYTEVKSILGESRRPTITPKQLSDMPYLKGCILESFRLSSSIPFFARLLKEDCIQFDYFIPKNTTILFSMYSTGREGKLFPNPLKFDPERWKRDEQHAFAIQPFGFGPRACYGRRFAELEIKILIAKLIHSFVMTTDVVDLKLEEHASLQPSVDVPIKFMDR